MSTRLLTPSTRVVKYLPTFRAFVCCFRQFSSHDEGTLTEVCTSDSYPGADIQGTVWPDTMLGPLSPKDKRFVMPGLVGPQSWNSSHALSPSLPPLINSSSLSISAEEVLQKLERNGKNIFQYMDTIDIERSFYVNELTPSDQLECVAQSCPTLLRKDFSELFPDRNIMEGNFTVITVSQKTENDMATYNKDVIKERKELLSSFMTGAQEICQALNDAGYWADFIDPSNGKPYFGRSTNTSFIETDNQYSKLGFEIEDLGCCKVIKHHKWGTHTYVGCLFTNAPLSLTVLETMVKPK